MEVLTQMRTSFDKPDHMAALFKKLTCNYTQTHLYTYTCLVSFCAAAKFWYCGRSYFDTKYL